MGKRIVEGMSVEEAFKALNMKKSKNHNLKESTTTINDFALIKNLAKAKEFKKLATYVLQHTSCADKAKDIIENMKATYNVTGYSSLCCNNISEYLAVDDVLKTYISNLEKWWRVSSFKISFGRSAWDIFVTTSDHEIFGVNVLARDGLKERSATTIHDIEFEDDINIVSHAVSVEALSDKYTPCTPSVCSHPFELSATTIDNINKKYAALRYDEPDTPNYDGYDSYDDDYENDYENEALNAIYNSAVDAASKEVGDNLYAEPSIQGNIGKVYLYSDKKETISWSYEDECDMISEFRAEASDNDELETMIKNFIIDKYNEAKVLTEANNFDIKEEAVDDTSVVEIPLAKAGITRGWFAEYVADAKDLIDSDAVDFEPNTLVTHYYISKNMSKKDLLVKKVFISTEWPEEVYTDPITFGLQLANGDYLFAQENTLYNEMSWVKCKNYESMCKYILDTHFEGLDDEEEFDDTEETLNTKIKKTDLYTAVLVEETFEAFEDTYNTVSAEIIPISIEATSDQEAAEKLLYFLDEVEYDYDDDAGVDIVNSRTFAIAFEDWDSFHHDIGDSLMAVLSFKRPDGTELATESELKVTNANDALVKYQNEYGNQDPEDSGVLYSSIILGKPVTL